MMPCDTPVRTNQTIQQRAADVRRVLSRVEELLTKRLLKVRVGPQGAIAFDGLSEEDRDGVTDACIYRRLMATGSALTRAQIGRAEQMAGRTVDRKVIANGVHSHDGGRSWNTGH
jgi:hypothetical protein